MDEKKDRRTILIVGETIDGRLASATERLGRQVPRLAESLNGRARGILTGHRIEAAARIWSRMAGFPVTVLDDPLLRYPNPAMTVSGLEPIALAGSTLAVCFPHSMRTCQTAAALAWRLKSVCVTAVDRIALEGSKTVLKRTIHGGRLHESLSADTLPLIMTVTPEAVAGSAPHARPEFVPAVATESLPPSDGRCIPRSISRQRPADQALPKARVVVAGGRGLGGPEQADMLHQVAGMFKDAAVGGSRGACDLGWLPHALQIGETGRTVAPALYLACGISGAPQHLAGMREAQTIVAVNSDPRAAIFNIAHYAVIEDLNTFLPLLLEKYAQTLFKGVDE